MNERLQELLRQRAAIDAEIERLAREGDAAAAAPATPSAASRNAPPCPAGASPAVSDPDEILQRYAGKPLPSPAQWKAGCWGALVVVLLLIGLAVFAIMKLYYL